MRDRHEVERRCIKRGSHRRRIRNFYIIRVRRYRGGALERYRVRTRRAQLDERHRRRDSAAPTINLYVDFGHGVTGRITAGHEALGEFKTHQGQQS